MPHFTQDNLQRIIINPFYAITVAQSLTEEHDPAMSEAEWVQANAFLMREMGSERWLRIGPLFAAAHPPLIEREMWVDVNVMQIHNMGAEGWLGSCWMYSTATS